MSIYSTLWELQFPAEQHNDTWTNKWIEVTAQGVPAFIGHEEPDSKDHCAEFLPPCPKDRIGDEDGKMRAVVFITDDTRKGSSRHGQEYLNPLLVLDGKQYDECSFNDLHEMLHDVIHTRYSDKGADP